MRWIVREGTERGNGERIFDRYANDSWDDEAMARHIAAVGGRTDCTHGAERRSTPSKTGHHGDFDGPHGRVVRLLTPAEAKRKAQAEALRREAERLRDESAGYDDVTAGDAVFHQGDVLDERADELWPKRGGR